MRCYDLRIIFAGVLIVLISRTGVLSENSQPESTQQYVGHLMPLGHQRPAEGDVETISGFPDAKTFFSDFVHQSEPVIFKGAARHIPAYKLWTDNYLKLVSF